MTNNKPTHEDELLSCPFCGGVAEYSCSHLDENEYIHQVTCGNLEGCHVANCFVQEYDKPTVIKAWNTRASTPPAPQPDMGEPKVEIPYAGVTGENPDSPTHTAPQAEGEDEWVTNCEQVKEIGRLNAHITKLDNKLSAAAQSAERLREELRICDEAYDMLSKHLDAAMEENTQLRLSLAKAEDHGRWRGIESAPRDGTWFLVAHHAFVSGKVVNIVCYHEGSLTAIQGGIVDRPIAWLPLPTPPQPAATPDEIGGGG